MLLLEPQMATRKGTIDAIAGKDRLRRSGLIVLAALWNDDLGTQFIGRAKSRLFPDDLLRAVAAYSVGNLCSFGANDLATVERMLRDRFPDQAVTITIDTIRKLVDLIDVDDVTAAIELLTKRARAAA